MPTLLKKIRHLLSQQRTMRTSRVEHKISKFVNFSVGKYHAFHGKYKGANNVILKAYKVIYFPIPKVACSTMLQMCANIIGINISKNVHETYFPSVLNIYENLDQYEDYFKFGFVRNPWDKLVSCYHNKILTDPTVNNRYYRNGVANSLVKYEQFSAGMSFHKFVDIIVDIPDLDLEKHLRPQHTFILNAEGKTIVDFVGRFENLTHDIRYVLEKMKCDNIKIPHIMSSSRLKYKDYYDENHKKKVAKKYQKDIELFDYTF